MTKCREEGYEGYVMSSLRPLEVPSRWEKVASSTVTPVSVEIV